MAPWDRKLASRSVIFVLLLLVVTIASGDEYKDLKGSYSIGGKSFYDPPVYEPKNTHIYFYLNGEAAKDLFDHMKIKAKSNVCSEDLLWKKIRNMQCTKSKRTSEYNCSFGIDIKNQTIVNGVAC